MIIGTDSSPFEETSMFDFSESWILFKSYNIEPSIVASILYSVFSNKANSYSL